ncbi:MAG: CASTOR/POLLUX-related putative ion channel [Cytophagaceae bacterium]
MKQRKSFRVKFRYWFDNTLSSGPMALIAWLGLVSTVIVITAAVIVSIFNIDPAEKDIHFMEALWISLMRTLDPGNLSSDNGWSFRIVMLLVTTAGLLIVSTLIGIVNAGLTQILENLRKGRSFVNEQNHILILGWSPTIFSLLNRLVVARKKGKKTVVVILGDKDKIEMEDEIKAKVFHDHQVRIICRSGSVIDRNDIEIVNPHEARTIVVMSQENDVHDIHSIKTIMALMKSHDRKSEKYHIIAEVRDRANLEVMKLIGKEEITPIVSEELFSRIMVQTSLQSGLSEVYNELLDFNDIEIDFIKAGKLAGLSFEECLLKFKEGVLIGIRNPDDSIDVNPKQQTIIGERDELILILRRKDGVMFAEEIPVNKEAFSPISEYKKVPQKTLLLGWNTKAPEIIRELDQYFVKGSEITVFAETEDLEQEIEIVRNQLLNQKVKAIKGNIRDKSQLLALMSEEYQHVILLCYSEKYDTQSADALTLITLIHLRQISLEKKRKFTIVSEILDIRNRALAEVTHADDFIVSDRLISMVMAQLACNISLKKIIDELLNPGGSEIYLRPVTDYVNIDAPVNFYTIISSVSRKGQTAIGYRIASQANHADKKYGVMLAPCKEAAVQFSKEDRIILISDQ